MEEKSQRVLQVGAAKNGVNRCGEWVKKWSQLSGLNRRPTVYKTTPACETVRNLLQLCASLFNCFARIGTVFSFRCCAVLRGVLSDQRILFPGTSGSGKGVGTLL